MDKLKKYEFKLRLHKLLGNQKKIKKYEERICEIIENQRWRGSKKDIQGYKYLHIMNNGIHSLAILEFIQKYFDNTEHCFIFPLLLDRTKEKIQGKSHIYAMSLDRIPINKAKKIIFHSLLSEDYVEFLYKHPKWLKKSYWFIWGGDLYSMPETDCYTYVHKNVRAILTSFDYQAYVAKYGEKKCYDVTYPSKTTYDLIDEHSLKSHQGINILVNNSADYTTLEMLDILSKYKDEDIHIYTILSYISKGQKDFRLQIMKKGYEMYGNRFHPLIDFMIEKDYANFLAEIDIYISNQNRAQGNGNASFLCGLGKKVFTKNDTGVFQKYNSLGIKYFDTYTIKDLSFKDFIAYDEKEKQQTIERLRHRMMDSTKVAQWKEFFLDD